MTQGEAKHCRLLIRLRPAQDVPKLLPLASMKLGGILLGLCVRVVVVGNQRGETEAGTYGLQGAETLA